MKRLMLVVVLVAACLLLFATPASAWYAHPQTPVAIIPSFVDENSGQWVDFNVTGTDPFDFTVRSDPIPQGRDVIVTREWWDTRLGATLIPVEYFNTMEIHKVLADGSTGPTIFAITKGMCGVRFWSPAYRFGDPVDPRVWVRDWWVHLGPLPKGDYSGTVTQFAPHAIPLWISDPFADPLVVNPLFHPDILQPVADSLNWTQHISFTVGN